MDELSEKITEPSKPVVDMLVERENIRLFLQLTVQKIVDFPDKVVVSIFQGEQTTVFQIQCLKEDVGKLIGKQGRTVSAVRELLRVMCGRIKMRAVLEVPA